MKNKTISIICAAIISVNCFSLNTAHAEQNIDYKIGVYFWPGWKNGPNAFPSPFPWDRIKPYPEREPLNGWYPDGNQDIIDQQIKWMVDYNIKYVVFSHVYDKFGNPDFPYAADGFIKSKQSDKMNFSIQWANHNGTPGSIDVFKLIITSIVNNYMKNPRYLIVNGKPALFLFSSKNLEVEASSFGATAKDLIDISNEIAIKNGLPGISWIGGLATDAHAVKVMKMQGYTAVSAYNYHNSPRTLGNRMSHNYDELDMGYRENWNRIISEGSLPLIVPMTSGWDKRPWGGTKSDSKHDNSFSNPNKFLEHLESAKKFIDKNLDATNKMGIICCWNEFGEGSYIHPTKLYKFSYLEKIRNTFKSD